MSSIPLPMHQPQVNDGMPLPAHEEDPYELVGMVMPGDPGQTEAMAEALIEEFILLGWNEKRLMTLFTNPFYLATHRIYRQKGAAYVEALITKTCARWRT
ncbi:MAG TPA: hypothetical protein VK879_18285 [Candidatus Sulfomarinibacteraceae bacterium]|nr:hypothetical protein [Candidatus Sulfomarinibacteraceae bacterium]